MATNLTPANDTWDGDPIVPDEGEEITAVTTGAGKGPLRRALQRLLDKTWSVVNGKVSLRALTVGPTAGSAVNPTAGQALISDLTVCPNYLGDQAAMQNYVQVSNLLAPIGASTLRGGRLAFTGVTTGAAEGGNPPRTTVLKNELRPVLMPKAWFFGKIAAGGGGWEFEDGIGILGMSFPGGNLVQFTFSSSFDSTNYCVVPHVKLGNDPLFPTVNRNAVNIMILDFTNADYRAAPGGAIDPAAAAGGGIEIHFTVFGRQT